VTIGVNLRILPAAAAAALALSLAPAASATVKVLPDGMAVCNTASQNWQGGSLEISPTDPQGALHYDKELRAMKDQGVGLYNAALQSRALAVCADAASQSGGGTGGDGTGDGGVGGGDGGWGGTGV
jgi:hypothetical protein